MEDVSKGDLRVFVATRLLEEVEAEIREGFDATFSETSEPLQELSAFTENFDAVIFSLDIRMGAVQIAQLPKSVRALATYSVGTDHIDLKAAADRGLVVFNTPSVLADSVAENAIFLMLGAARRATESIHLIRSQSWKGWNPRQLVGFQLSGRTLGILGLGDIGLRIAIRANALGMNVLYSNRRRPSLEDPFASGFRASAVELIRECDVLVLACPSTNETRGMIDAALLREAKPELILINIARGDLIDDRALISALQEGRVWAAGLDVFAGEPEIASGYFGLPNVFMLPHIGSSTMEARMGMGQVLIEALSAWQKGEVIESQVRGAS